jgi:hypothetical protein
MQLTAASHWTRGKVKIHKEETYVRTDATQRMRMFSRNLEHQYSLTGNAGVFGFRDDVSRSRRRSDRGAHSSAARVPPFGQLLRPPVSDTSQDRSSGFGLFASTLQGCLVSSIEPFLLALRPWRRWIRWKSHLINTPPNIYGNKDT